MTDSFFDLAARLRENAHFHPGNTRSGVGEFSYPDDETPPTLRSD